MIISQGDSYYLGITVLNNARSPVTPADIRDVEITIGPIRKTYRNAALMYSDNLWLFPVSQQESFSLWPMAAKSEIRIVWANGVIERKPIHGIRIDESFSKEVL